MIIRARPKYLKPYFFKDIENMNIATDENEMFFNSGRSALLFFLQEYSSYLDKELTVVTQAFNCVAVSEAILQSNSLMYLVDIGLEDFSIRLDTLKSIDKKIDVLILTHYQGIVNIEYEEIVLYCKENNILLIDDLAQTYKSSINGIEVGTLSNISINSFAFDKPISTLQGGSIVINMLEKKLKGNLKYSYVNLECQNTKEEINDIKILELKYKYSDDSTYNYFIESDIFMQKLLLLSIKKELVYTYLSRFKISFFIKLFNKVYSKFFKTSRIEILKIGQNKINLINLQRQNYKYNFDLISNFESFLKENKIEIAEYKNEKICWNRYSIIDKNMTIKNILRKFNVQIGNYNWSVHLGDKHINNQKVLKGSQYKNSDIASKCILNIPIWTKFWSNNNK